MIRPMLRFGTTIRKTTAIVLLVVVAHIFGCSIAPVHSTPQTCSLAQAAGAQLNSERIEGCFGSYGVEVLVSEGRQRVTSLYSVENSLRVLRTFAVTEFEPDLNPALSRALTQILSGESIGATLKSEGWAVDKSHRYIGVIAAGAYFVQLARLDSGWLGRPLAIHVYDLRASRAGQTLAFATIAEVHHPNYLSVADLEHIYGTWDEDLGATLSQVSRLMRLNAGN